jgi:hypothetical protein
MRLYCSAGARAAMGSHELARGGKTVLIEHVQDQTTRRSQTQHELLTNATSPRKDSKLCFIYDQRRKRADLLCLFRAHVRSANQDERELQQAKGDVVRSLLVLLPMHVWSFLSFCARSALSASAIFTLQSMTSIAALSGHSLCTLNDDLACRHLVTAAEVYVGP